MVSLKRPIECLQNADYDVGVRNTVGFDLLLETIECSRQPCSLLGELSLKYFQSILDSLGWLRDQIEAATDWFQNDTDAAWVHSFYETPASIPSESHVGTLHNAKNAWL